mgnify:CR=1 FL=1
MLRSNLAILSSKDSKDQVAKDNQDQDKAIKERKENEGRGKVLKFKSKDANFEPVDVAKSGFYLFCTSQATNQTTRLPTNQPTNHPIPTNIPSRI